MSTAIRRSRLRTALASICFLVAGAGIGCVQRQVDVDDGTSGAARDVATAVSITSLLDERCAVMARNLAEAGIRAATALTSARRKAAATEARAAADYERSGCPIRALPGIAFGVHEAARGFHARMGT